MCTHSCLTQDFTGTRSKFHQTRHELLLAGERGNPAVLEMKMGEVVKQQITQQGNNKQGTSVASAAPGPGSYSILSRGSVIRLLSSQPVTVWVAKATCITLLSQHCLSSWICSPEDSALLTKGGGGGICMYMHARTQKRFLYFYLPKGKMYSKQFLSNAFLLQTPRTNLMGEQTDIRPSVRLWQPPSP